MAQVPESTDSRPLDNKPDLEIIAVMLVNVTVDPACRSIRDCDKVPLLLCKKVLHSSQRKHPEDL